MKLRTYNEGLFDGIVIGGIISAIILTLIWSF